MSAITAIAEAFELGIRMATDQDMAFTQPDDWELFGLDTPVLEAQMEFIDKYDTSPKFIVPSNTGFLLGPIPANKKSVLEITNANN